MPISIGIFTARQSLENIRTVDQEMRRRCTVTYFPYESMAELGKLYEKNSRKFDGILFSGPIPREYVHVNIGPTPTPSPCIDLGNRDFYLAAARLFAANPGLDFSRVYFDTIVDPAVFRNIFDYGNYPPPIHQSATLRWNTGASCARPSMSVPWTFTGPSGRKRSLISS